jgi:hypothetical protein
MEKKNLTVKVTTLVRGREEVRNYSLSEPREIEFDKMPLGAKVSIFGDIEDLIQILYLNPRLVKAVGRKSGITYLFLPEELEELPY